MLVSLNEILPRAQKEGYAVGLFNTIDTDMLEGVLSAAEELRSPVIIGTAEVLLPYGELKLIAPSLLAAARRASVPVAVHYDHGLTLSRCIEALSLGFSSIMYDGSTKPVDENLRETRELVRIAHAFGASVEGEIGHVGNVGEDAENYTTPEEAREFIASTGVDALAIAIGTAHGAYKTKPRLDIGRLKQIRAAVDTPLVLHGGSGLTDEDFRSTVAGGIAKINIFTDLCVAGLNAVKECPENDYLLARKSKVEAIRQATMAKMRLFGSVGKA